LDACSTRDWEQIEVPGRRLDRPGQPGAVVREEVTLSPRSAAALAAGSAGPWETGGITDYQLQAARAPAASRDHTPWHPDPHRR